MIFVRRIPTLGKKLFLSSPLWNTDWIRRLKWKISNGTQKKFRLLFTDALLNPLLLLFSIRKERTHQKPKETVIKRFATDCVSSTLEFSTVDTYSIVTVNPPSYGYQKCNTLDIEKERISFLYTLYHYKWLPLPSVSGLLLYHSFLVEL